MEVTPNNEYTVLNATNEKLVLAGVCAVEAGQTISVKPSAFVEKIREPLCRALEASIVAEKLQLVSMAAGGVRPPKHVHAIKADTISKTPDGRTLDLGRRSNPVIAAAPVEGEEAKTLRVDAPNPTPINPSAPEQPIEDDAGTDVDTGPTATIDDLAATPEAPLAPSAPEAPEAPEAPVAPEAPAAPADGLSGF